MLAQTGLLGKVEKQAEGFVRDAVFREVEVQTQSLQREAFAAMRIVCKELSKV